MAKVSYRIPVFAKPVKCYITQKLQKYLHAESSRYFANQQKASNSLIGRHLGG